MADQTAEIRREIHETLKFYASRDTYREQTTLLGGSEMPVIPADRGKRARAVIEKIAEAHRKARGPQLVR